MDKPDWMHPQGPGLDLPPEPGRPGRFQELEDEYIGQHWGELFKCFSYLLDNTGEPNA